MLYAKLMLIVFGSILALSLVTTIGRSLRRGIGEWQCAVERRQREAAAIEEAERREAERAENERLAQEQKAADAEARKIKRAEAEAKAKAKEEERQRRQAERVEAARQIAEYNERALIAARELKALDHGNAAGMIDKAQTTDAAPQDKPRELVDIELPPNGECPSVLYDLMQTQPDEPKPVEKTKAAPALPQTFAGQVVAFTGKLKGMTRRQAAEQVNARGGRGCVKEMPVGTTILVVGDGVENSGKMQKADRWAGQQRVISQSLFFEMLNAV